MLKLKLQNSGHLMRRADSLEKTLMLGKTEGRRRRGVAENEMVGWHHRLNGHEFEQALGGNEGLGSLPRCSPWGHRVRRDLATEQQQYIHMCWKKNKNWLKSWMKVKSESVSRSGMSISLQPHELQSARLLCPWDSPDKNTGVGCHSLLQGIFPTRGSTLSLLHCRQILYCLSPQGWPHLMKEGTQMKISP